MEPMNKKPDFKTMTYQELKSYVWSHWDDDEAFYTYVDKIKERKDRVVYPPLKSLEDLEKYPEVIEKMRQDFQNNFPKNNWFVGFGFSIGIIERSPCFLFLLLWY